MEFSPVDAAAQVHDLPPAYDLQLALDVSGAEAKCLFRKLYLVCAAPQAAAS